MIYKNCSPIQNTFDNILYLPTLRKLNLFFSDTFWHFLRSCGGAKSFQIAIYGEEFFLWLVGPCNIRGFIFCGWALQHPWFHFLWLGLTAFEVSFSVVGPYNNRGFISCGWALQHPRFQFLWLGLTAFEVSFSVVGPYNNRGFISCGWALQHPRFQFLWLGLTTFVLSFPVVGWSLQHPWFHFLWLGLTTFEVSFPVVGTYNVRGFISNQVLYSLCKSVYTKDR